MTPARRVLNTMHQSIVGVLVAAAMSSEVPVWGQTAASGTLQEFEAHITDYLKLRQDLGSKLQPLSTAADGTDLAARQAALTAAIRAARRTAKPGDVIPPSVARLIVAAIVQDIEKRGPQASRAIFEEIPPVAALAVNRDYPAEAALATMPPLLLSTLPELPESLQYRFLGRSIVIMDVDTELIIDYVPDVLPTR